MTPPVIQHRVTAATTTTPGAMVGAKEPDTLVSLTVQGEFKVILPRAGNPVFEIRFPMLSRTVLESAAATALLNLIDARDFLGLQLSNALGCISDDELEKSADFYLAKNPATDDEIRAKTEAIVALIGSRADTEIIATALKCDLDRAENALVSVAKSILDTTSNSAFTSKPLSK